jgi:hypothetical protein
MFPNHIGLPEGIMPSYTKGSLIQALAVKSTKYALLFHRLTLEIFNKTEQLVPTRTLIQGNVDICQKGHPPHWNGEPASNGEGS